MGSVELSAGVASIKPLTDTIMQVMVRPHRFVDYIPGQYLQVMVDGAPMSFSIANTPDLKSGLYELHVRHCIDNEGHQRLLAQFMSHQSFNIQLPFGDCHVQALDRLRPVIFVAGGTGFAQVKAMMDDWMAAPTPTPCEFFWGMHSMHDVYMQDKIKQWQTSHPQFNYYEQVSSNSDETLMSLFLKKHAHDMDDWQIVLSGPFGLVYDCRDACLRCGALKEHIHADAFAFENTKRSV